MPDLLKYLRRQLAYGLLCLLDHSCWLLIHSLPGPQLLDLARTRPWRRLQLPLGTVARQRWTQRLGWMLARRCRQATWGSTCLSRSLCGRLLLDLIGVPNCLSLGMSHFPEQGRRVPHAWLSDPHSDRLFTPGLPANAGVHLTSL